MTVKIVVIMPSYRDIEKDIIKYNLNIIYLWSRQWFFLRSSIISPHQMYNMLTLIIKECPL